MTSHSLPAPVLRRARSWPGSWLALCLLPLLLLLLPAAAGAQRLDALHAGSVANAADELLVIGPEIDSAAPGDLVLAVGEGFGDDAGAVRVLLGDRAVLPLPQPLFQPDVVAFVVPLWAEGAVEVRVAVGEGAGGRLSDPRSLRVETPPGLEAPPGYARRTLQATLALTFLLDGEVRLASEAGVPLRVEEYGETLAGHRRAVLEALAQMDEISPEQERSLDAELFDANALERLRSAAQDLARRGPDCDDVDRFAGHAANGLSAAGSIVGACVPGIGGCIGGILSGLGSVASSVQAEAARECARQAAEEEKKRWEDLFKALDELKSGQARLESKLDRLEGAVAEIDAKLVRVETKVDRLESKLDNLERKADRQAEALAKLEAKADKIERKLDRQEKKLDTLEIKLDRLEIKADKAEKKLDKIESKLDRQEKKLDKIEAKLDRQEQKLDSLEIKADKAERKLDRQEGKLDRLERKLDRPGGGGGGGGPGPEPESWDFGDAPDGEAPTGYDPPGASVGRFPSRRVTPRGATGHGIRHEVEDGAGDRLGPTRTGEAEALTIDRDRDDLAPLVTDRRGRFDITVNAGGEPGPRHLNVLCDLDRDGDWDDPGDWVVANRVVSLDPAGTFLRRQTVEVVIDPDGDLEPGRYWLRISLTRPALPGSSWDGSGPAEGYEHGETEDVLLEVR